MSRQSIVRAPAEMLEVARELGVRPERVTRRRARTLGLLSFCCVALIPWIVYLAISMPSGYHAKAWSAAWVGFDVLLLVALGMTALCALLRRQAAIPLATVSATLLVCDAWFDIALDWGTPDVRVSIASAVLVELPLAAFLGMWARTLLRVTALLQWRQLGLEGDPPALHRLPLLFMVATHEEQRQVETQPGAEPGSESEVETEMETETEYEYESVSVTAVTVSTTSSQHRVPGLGERAGGRSGRRSGRPSPDQLSAQTDPLR